MFSLGEIDVEGIDTDTELRKVWVEVKTACSEGSHQKFTELQEKIKVNSFNVYLLILM